MSPPASPPAHPPERPPARRRVRVSVEAGARGRAVERWAADLARTLEAEVDAVFVESEELLALARLPAAREITAVTRQARGVDALRLEQELRAMAAAARRRMERLLREAGLAGGFRTARGDPAATLAGELVPGDLVVLAQPGGDPGARRAVAQAGAAALAAGADVLLVPRAAARGALARAPVAVAAGAGPEAAALAARLARARGAPLAVIEDRGKSLRQVIDAAGGRAATMLVVDAAALEDAGLDQAAGGMPCSVLIVGSPPATPSGGGAA